MADLVHSQDETGRVPLSNTCSGGAFVTVGVCGSCNRLLSLPGDVPSRRHSDRPGCGKTVRYDPRLHTHGSGSIAALR